MHHLWSLPRAVCRVCATQNHHLVGDAQTKSIICAIIVMVEGGGAPQSGPAVGWHLPPPLPPLLEYPPRVLVVGLCKVGYWAGWLHGCPWSPRGTAWSWGPQRGVRVGNGRAWWPGVAVGARWQARASQRRFVRVVGPTRAHAHWG